jgi:hypothetical protein
VSASLVVFLLAQMGLNLAFGLIALLTLTPEPVAAALLVCLALWAVPALRKVSLR